MNLAKNADSVRPSERIAAATKERRSARARRYRAMFHIPAAGFVLALMCLAYQNVQHRDQVVELTERYEAAIDARDRRIAELTKPAPMACRSYSLWMEQMSIEHCQRTVTKL